MGKKKHSLLSTLASRVTAMISVAMVLTVLGIMALTAVVAHGVTDTLRSDMGFVVVMSEDATPAQINEIKRLWSGDPRVASVRYSSPAQVLARWQEIMGGDDDPVELLGANPFCPEIEVRVKPQSANSTEISRLTALLSGRPGVNDVRVQADVIENVNSTISRAGWIMAIIAMALLTVSVVLINNTIRLTIYSRRFIINTMKLVGATGGFIRRPFVNASIINGFFSGLIAIVLLSGLVAYISTLEPGLAAFITWQWLAAVAGGVLIAGMSICGISALFATNRYLRLGYDQMFK